MKWFFAFQLAAVLAAGASLDDGPRLLFTGGPFHGDEVTARPDSQWLGLFPVDGRFELAMVTVSISLANDPIVDSDDEATGKQVAVSRSPEPIVLIPLEVQLKEGIVRDAGLQGTLVPGKKEVITFYDTRYVLAVIRESTPEGQCLVTFDDGKKSQVLAHLNQCDEDGYPTLIWSGDLNRDKRL